MDTRTVEATLAMLKPILEDAETCDIQRGSREIPGRTPPEYEPTSGVTIIINGGASHPKSFLDQREANAKA